MRQEAPCKNAAGRDIMKAKFVFIPGCRYGPAGGIALHQCLGRNVDCRVFGDE
jgi:hypothetical protein